MEVQNDTNINTIRQRKTVRTLQDIEIHKEEIIPPRDQMG